MTPNTELYLSNYLQLNRKIENFMTTEMQFVRIYFDFALS